MLLFFFCCSPHGLSANKLNRSLFFFYSSFLSIIVVVRTRGFFVVVVCLLEKHSLIKKKKEEKGHTSLTVSSFFGYCCCRCSCFVCLFVCSWLFSQPETGNCSVSERKKRKERSNFRNRWGAQIRSCMRSKSHTSVTSSARAGTARSGMRKRASISPVVVWVYRKL